MGDNECIPEAVKTELKNNYLVVRKLLDEESKNDPDSEPYRSKYKAMEILKNMDNLLFNSVDNTKQLEIVVISMRAVIYLNMGIVAIETEELKAGEDYLMNCIDTISKTDIQPGTILPMISALNQLGILWSKREQTIKAKEFLEHAEKVYKDYMNSENAKLSPIGMSNLFNIEDPNEPTATDIIEKLHTLTLYYLAQVYGSLEDFVKSAVYCHMTLKRQLEMNDFDSIDWALNAATLSQFFMEKGAFEQARHHLAAATYILEKHEESLKESNLKTEGEDNDDEIMAAKWENFKHRRADISRCWAKYGILLMSASKDRLIAINEGDEDKLVDESDSTNENLCTSQDLLNNLRFETLEEDAKHIAENVTDKYLLDFNDGKQVFLNVQKWLDDAKSFYTLETHASDYVQIIQDMSQLYKYLTFFEEDESRQAKMLKRRIDLLEGIVKELNEKYYQSACQQIWVELGETYSELLDIKLDRLKNTEERPTPRMLTKINNLVKSAIDNFTKFLDSLKGSGSEKFSDEMIKPALAAYFHLARLHNKFITPSKQIQLENTKKSLDAYTFLVNYCEKNPKAGELMPVELNIWKDFVKLLPVKISKLSQEIKNS